MDHHDHQAQKRVIVLYQLVIVALHFILECVLLSESVDVCEDATLLLESECVWKPKRLANPTFRPPCRGRWLV